MNDHPASRPSLTADLDHILDHTRALWEELRGGRLFITGGTGFIGCWLLESFARANDRLGLGAEALVLTRNAAAFAAKAPHLAARADIRFHTGDTRDFAFPPGGFSHVIHAATEASAKLNDERPDVMLDTIVRGTARALEFSARCRAEKFLLTSSGAVYGRQPPEMTHVPEDYLGGPDVSDPRYAYAEGKRISELMCAIEARRKGFEPKIARVYALVGPYLPLDIHFAMGNFIRDALAGGPVRVNADGTPYRSYLYAADLAIWLWTLLFRGAANRPYNVGSRHDLTIAELAAMVSRLHPGSGPVVIAREPVPGRPAERYVPDTARAERELGLRAWVPLEEAIRRTSQWHRFAAGDKI
jgi:dTDP-glucose 4,6-dehydratase